MASEDGGTITRVFVFADVLEDGTYLFRTEYGSLITEKVLLRQVRQQIERATQYLDSPHEQQKLTVVVTVDAMDMADTSPANGEEAQKE